MSLLPEQILAALGSGSFDSLVGEFETSQLECKRQPYDLASEEQKLELAKDVSALANAAGGLLVIGYSTVRDEAHQEDRIDRCRPFPLDRFDMGAALLERPRFPVFSER